MRRENSERAKAPFADAAAMTNIIRAALRVLKADQDACRLVLAGADHQHQLAALQAYGEEAWRHFRTDEARDLELAVRAASSLVMDLMPRNDARTR